MARTNDQPHGATMGDSIDTPTASAVVPDATVSHSPLPWVVESANDPGECRTFGIGCADGWTIADLNDDGFGGNDIDTNGSAANAEFIVRACNNHEALIAMLREFVGMYSDSTRGMCGPTVIGRLVRAEALLASVDGKGQ